VVECLPSKLTTQSSIPSTAKRRQNSKLVLFFIKDINIELSSNSFRIQKLFDSFQTVFCDGFFEIGSQELFAQAGFLLSSVSWVTGDKSTRLKFIFEWINHTLLPVILCKLHPYLWRRAQTSVLPSLAKLLIVRFLRKPESNPGLKIWDQLGTWLKQ
jgi:hypothetical protein